MKGGHAFLMAAGGTGGHVVPALAVARELRKRGHEPFFVGKREGIEARLVPAEGFPIEWIEIGGLKRVGWRQAARSLGQIPRSVWRVWRLTGERRPRALFSMGGYVAGPSMAAAWLRGVPMILMEPNAVAGMTNRWMGRFVRRALLNFESAAAGFPRGRTEVTGVPVREEFFRIGPKKPGGKFTLLLTGGSRGSRRLNAAARQSWPLLRKSGLPVRVLHQCGGEEYPELRRAFEESGVEGEIRPFIADMAAAFAEADLVVCRSGAGSVAELAAAGKPSILVPFPFAADQHQLRNAEEMAKAGAARLLPDRELSGETLHREVAALASDPSLLAGMGEAARRLARPGAAARAADLLEELAAEPARR